MNDCDSASEGHWRDASHSLAETIVIDPAKGFLITKLTAFSHGLPLITRTIEPLSVDGIWVPKEIHETRQRTTATDWCNRRATSRDVKLDNFIINPPLDDSQFTIDSMELRSEHVVRTNKDGSITSSVLLGTKFFPVEAVAMVESAETDIKKLSHLDRHPPSCESINKAFSQYLQLQQYQDYRRYCLGSQLQYYCRLY